MYEEAYAGHSFVPSFVRFAVFGLCNGAVMCEVDRLVFMSVFKYIAFLVSAYFLDP